MTAATPPQQLDDWIAIDLDGGITAYSGKVELGTGVRTALAQIVAEELDVPFERVHLVMGDTARTPDEGYTAGSMTLQTSGMALRQAAAEARLALLEMASDRLDATLEELTIEQAVIQVARRPERSISYAALMGGQRFKRAVTGRAPLKAAGDYRVVGASWARVDLPDKLTGRASFIQDVRLPGMRHARVIPPPDRGAALVSVEEDSVADLPGSVQVVVRGNFVGVVAEREEQAIHAAQRLRVTWRRDAARPPQEELYAWLRAQEGQEQVVVESGAVEAVLGKAAKQISAVYCQPYHAHASMGPSCAVADVKDGQYTVWTSNQGPFPLRGALAEMLGAAHESVHVMHVEGAAGYGQNGSDDAAGMAVLLAQAVGGPVRLQWSRAMEFAWEPFSAAMVMEVRAGLDASGQITAWGYDAWTPTHSARPRRADQLLAAQWRDDRDRAQTRGFAGGDRNAATSYAIPNQRVSVHWLAESALHTSSFRALGGTGNTFANESFMDELAGAAGADPVAFRLRHLSDPRLRAVLEAAAERAGWLTHQAAREAGTRPTTGMGVACAQYKNRGAYVATVAEVEVTRETGEVRVRRIVVAHDCGLIVNPDGVKHQIEGNVIQSLSRALKEEVRWDVSGVTTLDWETYPILKFSEMPEVEIVLLNRPDLEALGVGEPATVTTAPAVANAIFDATGARLRQVPFTPARVKAALAGIRLA
jgi:nicotinate dehydrogenase subunit B